MNCPNCTGPLVSGEAFFKTSAANFMAYGFGATDLRMKKDSGEELSLLYSSEKTAVQFCHECGVAVIATEKGRRPAARKAAPPGDMSRRKAR